MYVSGGYASRLYNQFSNCGPYACGDTDASAYRYFMADLWQSADGNIWTLLTEGYDCGLLFVSCVPYLQCKDPTILVIVL